MLGGSQLPLILAPEDPTPSSRLCKHLHLHMHVTTHVYIILKTIKINLKKDKIPAGYSLACNGVNYWQGDSIILLTIMWPLGRQ